MTKRATRFKVEVVDRNGVVLWEVLAHDMPVGKLTNVLSAYDYKIRRVRTPTVGGTLPLTYSELDPENSIIAAREYASRRDTHVGNALLLLLDRAPDWVPREQVRKAGGDSGDRRVRELRQRGWPIEIKQLSPGDAWHVRLALPGMEAPERPSGATLF